MKKILIVEDQIAIIDGKYYNASFDLSEEGWEEEEIFQNQPVEVVNSVAEALQRLSSGSYSHVVTDLGLPASGTYPYEVNNGSLIKLPLNGEERKSEYTSRLIALIPLSQTISIWRCKLGSNEEEDYVNDTLTSEDVIEATMERPTGYGVLVAKECTERSLPFTVYTNDVTHGLFGIALLALSGLVPANTVKRIAKRHSRESASIHLPTEKREQLFISADRKFAIGYKWVNKNWERLLDQLTT